MKILLTGANGYIGKRMLTVLTRKGHYIYAAVRDKSRFEMPKIHAEQIQAVEIDFLNPPPAAELPLDFDVAFFLIHSMSSSTQDFASKEALTAENFSAYISQSTCKQAIFLSGLMPGDGLSPHMASRREVERILLQGKVPATVLRAGIIIGSGSASFEIIRDLTEKLPVMVTPRWVSTLCQPIAVGDVIRYLQGVMLQPKTFNQIYDIGGPEVLSYKQMMLKYAQVRGLKRYIFTLPIMTPRLSSYWLYFITSTSYKLAVNLVDSMKMEAVCRNNAIKQLVDFERLPYTQAIDLAFEHIEQNMVVSSWKDALITSSRFNTLVDFVEVPYFGCYKDHQQRQLGQPPAQVLDTLWAIGGQQGWYYATWLWKARGYMDKAVGGIGLRRGRTNQNTLEPGDALDFWRVLIADRTKMRLLLYAEMKLPGEAWLEFRIEEDQEGYSLHQIATFRPHGLIGRLYWLLVKPFHTFIFKGMLRNILKHARRAHEGDKQAR